MASSPSPHRDLHAQLAMTSSPLEPPRLLPISHTLLRLSLHSLHACPDLFQELNLLAWQHHIERLVALSDTHSLLSSFLSDPNAGSNFSSYFALCRNAPLGPGQPSLPQPHTGVHKAFLSPKLLAFFKEMMALLQLLCEAEALGIVSACNKYQQEGEFLAALKTEANCFQLRDFRALSDRIESFQNSRMENGGSHEVLEAKCLVLYCLTLDTLSRVSAENIAKARINLRQCKVLQLAYRRVNAYFVELMHLFSIAGAWHPFLSVVSLFDGIGKELCRLLLYGRRFLTDCVHYSWVSWPISRMVSHWGLLVFVEDLDFHCKQLCSKIQAVIEMIPQSLIKAPNLELLTLQPALVKAAEYDHQALRLELQTFLGHSNPNSHKTETEQTVQTCLAVGTSQTGMSYKTNWISTTFVTSFKAIAIRLNSRGSEKGTPEQNTEHHEQTILEKNIPQTEKLHKAKWLSQSILSHCKLEFETSRDLFIEPEHVKRGGYLEKGSTAEVYEVTCWGDKYAMKQLWVEIVPSRDELFLQFRLPHPHIVRVIGYTSGVEGNQNRALLMELMTCSLRSHIDKARRPFPEVVAVDIMLQIAKAIEYLHRQKILHRDIKASNVLVDGEKNVDYWGEGFIHVKIADFGNARECNRKDLTAPIGTLCWRAPEITSNRKQSLGTLDAALDYAFHQKQDPVTVSEYDFRADVYSFGITCYEIVSGKLPYEGKDPNSALLQKIVNGLRPALPENIHRRLSELIKACWDGKPERRPLFPEICRTLREIKFGLLDNR